MLNNADSDAFKVIREIKNSQMVKSGGITITLVINGEKFQEQLQDILDCFYMPLTCAVDFYYATINGMGDEE